MTSKFKKGQYWLSRDGQTIWKILEIPKGTEHLSTEGLI